MLDQAATVAFLSRAESYGERGSVERIETHISIIFLVGERAFKLKRAVAFSYLDFTTPDARRKNCEAEFRLGQQMAPRLYRALHTVTREADERLVWDGVGEPIDTVIEMRRFDQDLLFDRLAAQGGITAELIRQLADRIAVFHAAADRVAAANAVADTHATVVDIVKNLGASGRFDPAAVAALDRRLNASLQTHKTLVARRARQGKFRHCHGDLHLGNICLLDGEPMLFDPVEFNPAISDIDVLYDVAFTLMDLVHAGCAVQANGLFNRYLDVTAEDGGLALLPLFLAMRATIRAHVLAAKSHRADEYFALVGRMLDSHAPSLVAIGGLSGTGKSTLAQKLAPGLGRVPGARILRTDAIRKRLHGVTLETRLSAAAYGLDVNRRVYDTLQDEAKTALAAGYTVIADATFLDPREREDIEAIAASATAPFTGIWLDAPAEILEERLRRRRNDVSDADVAVLRAQFARDLGPIGWRRLPADDKVAHAVADLLASA